MVSKIDYRALANPHIRNLTPYQPGKPIEELERELGIKHSIKLASNENPLGPSPKALIAAQEALLKSHFYPDGGSYELKQTLASFLSVQPNQITVGNGSENVLEIIIKAYLHKECNAVISQYAFLTILLLIQSSGAQAKITPANNFGHDIPSMIQAIDENTRLLFLVNPNNPTGTYTTEKDFQLLMESVPPHVLVIVDEAYVEYIEAIDYPNALAYLNKYPNLIITRSFSKVYGLAALRLGYAISSPEIADILNRARLPFNVNTIAAKAACAAVKDIDHVKKSVAMNREGKQQLQQYLQKMQLSYIPSIGNFISIDVADAKAIYQKLLYAGVIVRPLHAYEMIKHIRVTIGTAEQNDRFIAAIKDVL